MGIRYFNDKLEIIKCKKIIYKYVVIYNSKNNNLNIGNYFC